MLFMTSWMRSLAKSSKGQACNDFEDDRTCAAPALARSLVNNTKETRTREDSRAEAASLTIKDAPGKPRIRSLHENAPPLRNPSRDFRTRRDTGPPLSFRMNQSTQHRQPSGQSFSTNDPSLSSSTRSGGTLRRRPSFNFLRRSKSTERAAPTRSVSGGKLTKRQRSQHREQEMLKEQLPPRAPRIPDLPAPPKLQSFGGESARPDSFAIISNRAASYSHHPRAVSSTSQTLTRQPSSKMYPDVPIPPIPGDPVELNGDSYHDPYARTESMTNRGRYSYASSVVSSINNPRKMRRRKDYTPFK